MLCQLSNERKDKLIFGCMQVIQEGLRHKADLIRPGNFAWDTLSDGLIPYQLALLAYIYIYIYYQGRMWDGGGRCSSVFGISTFCVDFYVKCGWLGFSGSYWGQVSQTY